MSRLVNEGLDECVPTHSTLRVSPKLWISKSGKTTVTFQAKAGKNHGSFAGVLDAGSSVSVMPIELVEKWKLREHSKKKLRTAEGRQVEHSMYRITIWSDEVPYRKVLVAATQRQDFLLGQDAMRGTVLVYNANRGRYRWFAPSLFDRLYFWWKSR